MQILRTPEDRFRGLRDYAFKPHYAEITNHDGPSLRLHYIDEGPGTAPPVLLLHGEPSWSYLYRKIILPLVAQGHRVLVPDLIGFGRSDKPAAREDYTFERHVAWMSDWLLRLDLSNITLFCQDWGGLIGLRLVARYPERFARVIVANTGLPDGSESIPMPFKIWLGFSQYVPRFPTGWVISMGTVRGLSPEEKRAYNAPFPDERYKAGARVFPTLVPITGAHPSIAENKEAWHALERYDRPFLTAFSDRDPITRGFAKRFRERVSGAQGQPHRVIKRAGHFLQEDSPQEIAGLIHAFALNLKC